MSASMHPARKLRIIGKPGDTRGYMLNVTDFDTGEPITNIRHIDLTLSIDKGISANVTYYVTDSAGKTLGSYRDGRYELIEQTDTTEATEIDLTAIENIED